MANQVHGPFVAGGSTNTGAYGIGVGQSNTYDSGNVNYDETQAAIALSSLNPKLISSGFVLSGATCTKDGTNANQLDIASGTAYLIQSDGTLARCDVGADNTHTTTGNPSTTMYLDLNPDGSWSWATTHSAVANHLTICSVTTDGSSNIASVADARPLNVELLTAMGTNGSAFVDVQALGLLAPDLGAGVRGSIGHLDNTNGIFSNAIFHNTPATGAAAQGHYWATWDGSATHIPFSVGGSFGGAQAYIGNQGQLVLEGAVSVVGGQTSVGNLGVPVIVAQVVNTHITVTTMQTVLSYTPSVTGLYRISGYLYINNGTSGQHIDIVYSYQDPITNTFEFVWPSGVAGSGVVVAYNAGTVIQNNYALVNSSMVYAKSGVAMTIQYQDQGGTPNDYVSFLIERVA